MTQSRRASKSISLVLITSASLLAGCEKRLADPTAAAAATQPTGSGYPVHRATNYHSWSAGHTISSGSSGHSFTASSEGGSHASSGGEAHGTSHGGFGSTGHAASS